jgi:hypothetical protein
VSKDRRARKAKPPVAPAATESPAAPVVARVTGPLGDWTGNVVGKVGEVTRAQIPESAHGTSESGVIGEETGETGGESPRNDVPRRSRVRDANGCLELRPGQPHIGSKLDDELEQKICNFVSGGMSWTDSARLCGVDRATTSCRQPPTTFHRTLFFQNGATIQ